MAGHNKWSKIKHRKAVVDKRRGKVWTKCSKAIIVAARNGGSDPAANLALRYAIDEARYANMPRDTIERAIKKGAGEVGGESWENVRYEGYGPGGVALLIDALTDNRTRTVGDLRLAMGKYGGNLGSAGCVSYMFEAKGQIVVRIDERYHRPAEVDTLLGDAAKAREKLGWVPEIGFAELVAEMVREDLRAAERETLVRQHGHAVHKRNDG